MWSPKPSAPPYGERLVDHGLECGLSTISALESMINGLRRGRAVPGILRFVAKVMVSLPDDVLRAVDVEAVRRGTTRSGLLRELAEESIRRRSARRADRMREIDALADRSAGHGGGAELVKSTRPSR